MREGNLMLTDLRVIKTGLLHIVPSLTVRLLTLEQTWIQHCSQA